MENKDYLFTSERLGFRAWQPSDIDWLAQMNMDPEVMRYFPAAQDRAMSLSFIERMSQEQELRRHCYWVAERKDLKECIGFIGLHHVKLDLAECPFVDLGYRLRPSAWDQGYASEGAARCLSYAQEELGLTEVFAIAPRINTASIAVMQRVGMQKLRSFRHPLLKGHEKLELCDLFYTSFKHR